MGKRVKVGWKSTQAGHEILLLVLESGSAVPLLRPEQSRPTARVMIGTQQQHTVGKRETLLDIARQYNLGFNEMQDLYPRLDPWVIPEGMKLIIPSWWIQPDANADGIVINIPELRMYYSEKNRHSPFHTFPLGLGEKDHATPLGSFRIGKKTANPTWNIPPSLRAKYEAESIPPGPKNPLGGFWMGLGNTSYGIHGTDMPWSVGRLTTRGCVRMYPEDIRVFFYMVEPGTPVNIIYEPVKIGFYEERVFVEVHRDIYNKIDDFLLYGYQRLRQEEVTHRVDLDGFRKALASQSGIPTEITLQTQTLPGIAPVSGKAISNPNGRKTPSGTISRARSDDIFGGPR